MILKRNLWNRIFHRSELKKQRSLYWRNKALVSSYSKVKEKIENSTDLLQLLAAHKLAWVYGFRNNNLGPCEFGMFRTKSIPDMTPDEVYLGNICGLWTFPLKEWQNKRGSENYNTVVSQYKNLLLSNVTHIMRVAKDYIKHYENHNQNYYNIYNIYNSAFSNRINVR